MCGLVSFTSTQARGFLTRTIRGKKSESQCKIGQIMRVILTYNSQLRTESCQLKGEAGEGRG